MPNPALRPARSFLPRLCSAALVALPLAAQVSPPPQPLPQGGVTLDNDILKLRFVPEANLNNVRVELWDSGPAIDADPFVSSGWRLWKFEVVRQPAPGPNATLVEVLPSSSPGPVLYTKQIKPDGLHLSLYWNDCSVGPTLPANPLPGERLDARIDVFLGVGEQDSAWSLHGLSHMTQHAFYSGRVSFSFVEKPGATHSLLMPLGYLVKSPAAALPTDEAAYFDMQIRPIAQLNAYYDTSGRGLYLASADGTGDATKNFRYGAAPDHSAMRIEAQAYGQDVSDPARDFDSGPARLGRFEGDWWTAAEHYRDWLAGTEIAGQGLLAERSDVPDFLKRYQHTIVFSPMNDYYSPCGGAGPAQGETPPTANYLKPPNFGLPPTQLDSVSVPERVQQYKEHWGLPDTAVLQFAANWPTCAYEGVGQYQLSPQWVQNCQGMQAYGHFFMLYLFDAWYRTALGNTCQQSYVGEGWSADTVVQLSGQPLLQDWDVGYGPVQFALIEPYADKWLSRMAQVALQLAARGVDGVYLDNFFPDLSSASYSTNQQHPPGLGSHFTEGYGRTLQVLRQFGRQLNPQFTTYTEDNFEAYIRRSDAMNPVQAAADLVTGDDQTEVVPLHAVLYHHLAVQGPASAGYYTRPPLVPEPNCPCDGFGSDTLTTFSCDPAERTAARRGAMYTLAFGWVHGSPLWTPDFGATSPKCYVFSYEIPDPPAGTYDCYGDYKAVCQYAAELSRVRGSSVTQPFLNVGRLMRPLAITSSVPVVDVRVTPFYPGNNDTEHASALVHAVWQETDGGQIAIAAANHSGLRLGPVHYDLDPQLYGLDPTTAYFVTKLKEDGVEIVIDLFAGNQVAHLAFPASAPESWVFLRIRPCPKPLVGGKQNA